MGLLLLAAVSATFAAGACSPHGGCGDFGGNLTLPLVLDSHMVLQRAPKQAVLWGWCSPAQAVAVQLDQQPAVRATADDTGFWKVTLAPQIAGVGHVIVITGADGARAMLADVAFGDVMVCSGQSHMTFSVNQDLNGTEAIGQSAEYPGIRMLTVGDASANSPLEDVAKLAYDRAQLPANSSWLPSAPSSFGTGLFSYPSAICYYYARELYVHFNGTVPMGVISSSVGGSPIEQWTRPGVQAAEYYPSNKSATCVGSRDALTKICGAPQAAAFEHAPAPTTAQVGWGPPGSLFNAMIYGLRHMTLRSVLWDQGEANNNDDCLYYGCKLATLAHDWRHNIFQDPSLLFTFDQFRAERFAGGADMPSFTSVIPHSTYATRLDLQTCYPNHTSAGHAVRKLEVGRRLAHAARVVEYGEAAGPLTFGPHIVGATVAPTTVPGLYNLTVQLQNAAGLHFHDAPELRMLASLRVPLLLLLSVLVAEAMWVKPGSGKDEGKAKAKPTERADEASGGKGDSHTDEASGGKGDSHSTTQHKADFLMRAGNVLDRSGHEEEAMWRFEEALPLYTSIDAEHPGVGYALNNMGALLSRQERAEEALSVLDRALAVRTAALGAGHVDVAGTLNNIGMTLRALERPGEALQRFNDALELFRKHGASQTAAGVGAEVEAEVHVDVAQTQHNMALVLEQQGKLDEALSLAERAHALYADMLGGEHPRAEETLNTMAVVLEQQGRVEEAMRRYEQALAIRIEHLGPVHASVGDSCYDMAHLAVQLENVTRSIELFEAAARAFGEAHGENSEEARAAREKAAMVRKAQLAAGEARVEAAFRAGEVRANLESGDEGEEDEDKDEDEDKVTRTRAEDEAGG
eukprot:g4805.t1